MKIKIFLFILIFFSTQVYAEKPNDSFSMLKKCITEQKSDALESQKKLNLKAAYLENLSHLSKNRHDSKNQVQQWLITSYSSFEADPTTDWGKYLKYSKQAQEVKALDDRFLYLENLFLSTEVEISSIESNSSMAPISEVDVNALISFSKTHNDYFKEISNQASLYGVGVSMRSCNWSKP